jgi:polyisoprenoid-binding protein YceI
VKRIFVIFLGILFPSVLMAETYTMDPDHSYVLYQVSHFGFSTQTGKWPANGTLVLDEQKPENSKVNVNISVDKLDTGNPELDKHLKGALFFDVTKYPTATFQSDTVTLTGKDSATVHGILTLHGVSKPITLTVMLNKIGTSLITNKPTVGFNGKTTLKRSDFGVSGLLPGVSDNVSLTIEMEAAKG